MSMKDPAAALRDEPGIAAGVVAGLSATLCPRYDPVLPPMVLKRRAAACGRSPSKAGGSSMKFSSILFGAAIVLATHIGVEQASAKPNVKESVVCKAGGVLYLHVGGYWACRYPAIRKSPKDTPAR
jgi:hypothetical protein